MEKVGFGVIGAGGIADRRTIPGILASSHCELKALMDVANQDVLSKKYDVPCYGTVEKLLNSDGVQAVYIASPVYLHLDQILAAAKAKKHILCEKPLVLTPDEAREAAEACRNEQVLLQEGYMMRLHGAHQHILKMLNEGRIGKPVGARAQLSCWYPPIDGAWRQNPSRGGGGALIDMATHLYDLLEMFFGPISKVYSLCDTLIHDYPVEDSSTTLLGFENGVQATVDSFFCIPDNASRTRLEIYGSKGSILAEGTIGQGDGGTLEVYSEASANGKAYDAMQDKNEQPSFVDEPFEHVNPYSAECDSLAIDIINGRKRATANDGSQAAHVLEIVQKAYSCAGR